MPESIDLSAAFAGFQRSAWRLCSLDAYDVPEEREPFAQWRARRVLGPRLDAWPELVHLRTAGGASMARVHIFTQPLTAYAEWSLALLPQNVAAGEDVRIVLRDELPPDLVDLREDFWIFDDRLAATMRYDEGGRFLGAVDASAELVRYRSLRDRLIAISHPVAEVADAVGQ